MLVALAGGVGAARLLTGIVRVAAPEDVTAVVNTGDDMVLHGLHVSPDIDTVLYTLAGLSNPETGWGLVGETWTVMSALEALGGESWFRLGDRDLATHLYRTQLLAGGATLSEVTAALAGARGLRLRVLPMSDDPVRTRLTLAEPAGAHMAGAEVAFQDYFVQMAHGVAVSAVRYDGAAASRPAPGVLDAIDAADVVIGCPSNPILSLGPVLAVPGVRDHVARRRTRVVAVSPIVAGAALKGPADRLLRELGHDPSVVGVAGLCAPWAGTLVIDEQDARLAPLVEAQGMRAVVAPTIMSTPDRAAALAEVVLDAAR
ncbi:MAG: 2-phospho-L-lactate transferase [Acidimicrobiales bacterium]